jgi:hypothetical protein
MAAINFPANPTVGQQFVAAGVTWTYDGNKWTALGNNLGIPDAPSDNQLYGRKNASWSLATGGGGGIGDAPIDGAAYARKSGGWTTLTHLDITDWTATLAPYALTSSVPGASSTTPLMDGTAAIGSGTTYARADHRHPTDTSKYDASNPTGYITSAAVPVASSTTPVMDGIAAVGSGTTWAKADHVHPLASQAIGDNRIINGDMRIDQRNNGASGTSFGYTVDRWFFTNALGTAGKGTWQQVGGTTTLGFPLSLQFTSASAYTPLAGDAFHFNQRIEGDMISDFAFGVAAARPITLSFWVWTSGLTYPATLGGAVKNYANTRSYPFTYSVPAGGGAWTFISVTIPGDTGGAWSLQGNGGAMTVCLDLGSGANFRAPAGAWIDSNAIGANGAANVVAASGAVLRVTGVKLEIGSVATPYNRQSLSKSLADCQRYYQKLGGAVAADIVVQGYAVGAGSAPAITVGIPAMRAAPTATVIGTFTTTLFTSVGMFPGSNSVGIQVVGSGAGMVKWFNPDATAYVTLNAEL